MSKNIGTSVGVWNTNKTEEQFFNVSGKPFFIPRLNIRQATSQIGANYGEYRERQKIYNDLTKNLKLTDFQINDYWNEYQSRGNTSSSGFKNFILDQLLLREAELEEEQAKLDLLKEDLIISDDAITKIQGNIPNDNTMTQSIQEPTETNKSRNPNLIIYSVIGLVVVTGIVILISKRR
tara:strand:+ start:1739 stop:2275 length:537 start_codon:yes stop_codon:yes gene_type:complete